MIQQSRLHCYLSWGGLPVPSCTPALAYLCSWRGLRSSIAGKTSATRTQCLQNPKIVHSKKYQNCIPNMRWETHVRVPHNWVQITEINKNKLNYSVPWSQPWNNASDFFPRGRTRTRRAGTAWTHKTPSTGSGSDRPYKDPGQLRSSIMNQQLRFMFREQEIGSMSEKGYNRVNNMY